MPKKRKPAKPARKSPLTPKTLKRARPAPASRAPRSADEDFLIPPSMLTAESEERPASESNIHEDFFIPANFGQVALCAWCETEHDGGPEHCPRGDEAPPDWEQAGDPGVDFKRLGQMRWTEHRPDTDSPTEHVVFSPEYDARGNCRYGCGGFASTVVSGIGMHHYSCAYWEREGKDRTPF